MSSKTPPPPPLTVLVCTANMGNAEPSLQDIQAWVPPRGACSHVTPLDSQTGFGTALGAQFDVIAVGMQEATWSQKHSQKRATSTTSNSSGELDEEDIFDTSEKDKEEAPEETEEEKTLRLQMETQVNKDVSKLASLLEITLGKQYKLVAEKQRGQMRLVILARQAVVHDISDLTIKCENTGVGHVLANKGGIVMSLTYQQTTRVSFLSAHLAAHEGDHHYAARCDNLDEILNGAKTHERYDVALSSHHFFIMGDLNFRTRFPESTEENSSVQQALALVEQEYFATLYDNHDELIQGMAHGDLLVDFQTLPCHFHPTFKVQREAGFVYKEQRTPSYTDRILYRSANKDYLKPLAYEPCPGFCTSDHKPIRGAYAITPNKAANAMVPKEEQTPGSYKIKFHSMSCSDLPALDVTGTSDPYILLTWDYIDVLPTGPKQEGVIMKWTSPGSRQWPKTQFLSRTLNPEFKGEELEISINSPVPAEGLLYVTVMDYDLHSQDDLMCTLPMTFCDLVAHLKTDESSTQVELQDRPLLRNGKYYGKVSLTLDIEKSNQPIAIDTKSGDKGCLSWLCGCLK